MTTHSSSTQSNVSCLPGRYAEGWKDPFLELVKRELKPGIAILDVGSGRQPCVPPDMRPNHCRYVGLDISLAELQAAESGSYDDFMVSDVTEVQPQLRGQYDLIVSWQVLEHVGSLDAAIDNLHSYLKPGGVLIAQFSGAFSVFGVANRVVPRSIGVWAMKTLLGRDPTTVFPAYYHHCWYGKLHELTSDWSEAEVIPRFRGAVYFRFSRLLQRFYVAYEDWAVRSVHLNLATHYLLYARS